MSQAASGRIEIVRAAARAYRARVSRSLRGLRRHTTWPDDADGWISAADVRIVWFVQTYRDLPRLRKTLARVRTLYPESQVLVVSDGDPDPQIRLVCNTYSADFTLRPRLFGVERGGEPVQRMLEAFLATRADILIKIDPDTNVRRRFSRTPPASALSVYGTVQSAGSESNCLTSIQGGCIIVPRQAAVLLTHSRLLESERLKPPALEWVVNEESAERTRSGLTSYDWTLGWACRELGLLSKNHPEVFSGYQPSMMDVVTQRQVAVFHPRFEMKQLANQAFYFSGLRAAVILAAGRPRTVY